MTFDEAREALDNAIDGLPPEIFRELNGGVILSPEAPLHPESVGEGLYVLGRYSYQPTGMGRYVNIYYGSFTRIYGGRDAAFWRHKLTEVLHHELVHHLESLAGDKSLEERDRDDIARYRARFDGRQ